MNERVLTATVIRNESKMLPWFLKHYEEVSKKIIVFDDQSDDGSQDIIKAHPLCELRKCPFSGMDEFGKVELARSLSSHMQNQFDWIVFVDIDEFIWSPNFDTVLRFSRDHGYDAIRSMAYNMMADGLPEFTGRQLWQEIQTGVRAPVYDKTIIFQPGADVNWARGFHFLENCSARVTPEQRVRLLHFRYMGQSYTASRNARNFDRSPDKGTAWSCAPDYHGEHSAKWAEESRALAFNVFA